MRHNAADDRAVVGIAGRVGLAVEEAADHRFVDHVDGVHGLQDYERMARHRAGLVMNLQPLGAPGQAGDVWRRRGHGQGQRLTSSGSPLT